MPDSVKVPRIGCRSVFSYYKDQLEKELIDTFDTVIFDCDGVLWRGDHVLTGAPDFVNKLKESYGKKVLYITNNSLKTRADNLAKLKRLGFPGELEDVFHAGYLAALYLKEKDFKKKAYVVAGSNAIKTELEDLGIQAIWEKVDYIKDGWTLDKAIEDLARQDLEGVGAVIVGFDPYLSYSKITKAANFLHKEKAELVVTDSDVSFPINDGLSLPGTGPLVRAIEIASGHKPVVCGKPSKFAFEAVTAVHKGVTADRTLIIGDRADSDILLGRNCSLKTLMVGSGVHSLDNVNEFEKEGKVHLVPDFFAKSLGEMNDILK